MASEFVVILNGGQYPQGAEAAVAALDLIQEIERQLSYFLPDSWVSRLNRLAGETAVEVPKEFFELIREALELSAKTEGAFEITSTPLWKAWGFARREGRVPSEEELQEARERTGWQAVELNSYNLTIRFLKPGMELSLGAIGKGYALDRAAHELRSKGVNDFLLGGGYSSVLAAGNQGLPSGAPGGTPTKDEPSKEVRGNPAGGGWEVGIRHPTHPGRRVGVFSLIDRALGTSGSAFQFFRWEGKRLSHILDPRTGKPADAGVLSVSVVASSARLADALSTAFYVLGSEQARVYCQNHPGVGALFALADRNPPGFRWETVGEWPGPFGNEHPQGEDHARSAKDSVDTHSP